jgi:hypothetical protein
LHHTLAPHTPTSTTAATLQQHHSNHRTVESERGEGERERERKREVRVGNKLYYHIIVVIVIKK